MTTIKTRSEGWDNPTKVAIGAHLLTAAEARTAAELATAVGRDQSNVKKVADAMVEEGLLIVSKPVRAQFTRGRGRRADSAYRLDPRQRPRLEVVALEETRTLGALRASQQLVFASTPGTKALDLMRTVSDSAAAARMSWIAFIDGQPQECVVAFDGDDALVRAKDLMAALAEAEVDSRRATVAGILDRHDFLRQRTRRPSS